MSLLNIFRKDTNAQPSDDANHAEEIHNIEVHRKHPQKTPRRKDPSTPKP